MYSFILNCESQVTPWHIAHGNKSHLVSNDGGGVDFKALLNKPGSNDCFLIKPDFTWEEFDQPDVGDEYFTSKDIYPHSCNTPIKHHISTDASKMFTHYISGENLIVESLFNEGFTVKIFSVSGKVLKSTSKDMIHDRKITVPIAHFSKGMCIIQIINGTESFVRSVVL